MTTGTTGCHSTCRGRPSWLQATLSDLEQRFRSLSLSQHHQVIDGVGTESDDNRSTDSFADRAENYYQKRPQLISLLHDLYHRYLSLADRYVQSTLKPHRTHSRSQSQISLVPSDLSDRDSSTSSSICDDAESSLSFQLPPPETGRRPVSGEAAVAELVARAIENELLRHEVEALGRQSSEASRKVGLQRSLLEVLESERAVLLNENARLGLRAAAAEEERDGAAAEAAYMRQRAEELARLVVKVREEQRVCALGRRVEALQAQVYALERRNRECYEAMARREEEKAELVRGVCVELEKVKAENRRLREVAPSARRRKGAGLRRRIAMAVEGWVICGGGGGGNSSRKREEDAITGCGGMTL